MAPGALSGGVPDKLLRTLQRRVKAWRARFGPDKEVMFPQKHGPGLRGLSDFTTLKGVGKLTWEKFRRLLDRLPLPQPRIVHWSI